MIRTKKCSAQDGFSLCAGALVFNSRRGDSSLKRVAILLLVFLTAPAWNAQAQRRSAATEQDVPVLLPIHHSLNGLVGYADLTGKQIIKPQFKLAGPFLEGVAPVLDLKNRLGYINRQGRMILRLKVEVLTNYSEGLAVAGYFKNSSPQLGYIDRRGKFVIPPQFDAALQFKEGIAPVMVKGKWGYINKSGVVVARPQFDVALDFSEGLAAVLVDDKWGYIDKTGAFVIRPQFDDDEEILYSGNFSEGLAAVPVNQKKALDPLLVEVTSTWGYINKAGEWIIKPQFKSAGSFSAGLAAVEIDGKWGYIDKNGNSIIRPQFDGAGEFSEGLAPVQIDLKWGYIDRTGKMIIQPQFFEITGFEYGVARVQIWDFETGVSDYGYINNSGHMIVSWMECEAYRCSASKILGGKVSQITDLPDEDVPRLIPVEIKSKPSGAKVYLIPIYRWNKEKDPINNQHLLERFELSDGTTDVDTMLDEQVFMVVFDLNGKRVFKRLDVISSKKNKVEAEIR